MKHISLLVAAVFGGRRPLYFLARRPGGGVTELRTHEQVVAIGYGLS